MLSILIPTFNYNAYPLVYELNRQAKKESFPFEILCYDDGSTIDIDENNKINTLVNASFKKIPSNIGRTAIRNRLAKDAHFEWLLFIDADMLPKKEGFIRKYRDCMTSNNPRSVVFGGCSYDSKHPINHSLRFYYGKKREEKPADIRSKHPYQNILSGNMLIQKVLFNQLKVLKENRYGLDPFFSGQLEKVNITPLHISNELYHLGLETNEAFLKKSKESALTIRWLYENNHISHRQSKLIAAHHWLVTMKLETLFQWTGKLLISPIKMLLAANKAPLSFLDLYRLYYYVTSKENQ